MIIQTTSLAAALLTDHTWNCSAKLHNAQICKMCKALLCEKLHKVESCSMLKAVQCAKFSQYHNFSDALLCPAQYTNVLPVKLSEHRGVDKY